MTIALAKGRDMNWTDLNERQQQYMQAIYETDQEQEAEERSMRKRGGRARPASVWHWMEYGAFDGVGSTLYTKLYLRKLVDEGTGSSFNALESRELIKCKYTWKRRDSDRETLEQFLMLQITKEGRALVRAATGAKSYRPSAPGTYEKGTGRQWLLPGERGLKVSKMRMAIMAISAGIPGCA